MVECFITYGSTDHFLILAAIIFILGSIAAAIPIIAYHCMGKKKNEQRRFKK